MNREPAVFPPVLVLLVAVAAMSCGGPLIKFASAPPQVMAAWRLIFSIALIGVVLLLRRTKLSAFRLSRADWLLAVGAGILLAVHFWVWMASLRLTSVASSIVLVNMQPIFVAALSASLLHERASGRQWLGILVACAGAGVIGFSDASTGPAPRDALLGDLLALSGAVFVAGYYVIGRGLRQRLDLWIYIAIVYGIAALVLVLAVVFDPKTDLIGYPTSDWWIFAALAAGPMMLGHTGVNYVLKYVPAYVANVAIMGEAIGATIIAWTLPALREVPSPGMLVGAVLILLGIFLGSTWRKP
jgi:drug/metabolite transporter (DMT)-like permease